MLHLWQNYVLKIQSNIFIIMSEMEDSYTWKEQRNTWRCIASHICMQESHIQTPQHEPTGPDHQTCGLSEPEPQHLYTLHLWYPAHPHSLQVVTTCHDKGREHECLKLFIQSNWTAQNLTFSHLMPHCGALSRHAVGWQAQAAMSNVANAW